MSTFKTFQSNTILLKCGPQDILVCLICLCNIQVMHLGKLEFSEKKTILCQQSEDKSRKFYPICWDKSKVA